MEPPHTRSYCLCFCGSAHENRGRGMRIRGQTGGTFDMVICLVKVCVEYVCEHFRLCVSEWGLLELWEDVVSVAG